MQNPESTKNSGTPAWPSSARTRTVPNQAVPTGGAAPAFTAWCTTTAIAAAPRRRSTDCRRPSRSAARGSAATVEERVASLPGGKPGPYRLQRGVVSVIDSHVAVLELLVHHGDA